MDSVGCILHVSSTLQYIIRFFEENTVNLKTVLGVREGSYLIGSDSVLIELHKRVCKWPQAAASE